MLRLVLNTSCVRKSLALRNTVFYTDIFLLELSSVLLPIERRMKSRMEGSVQKIRYYPGHFKDKGYRNSEKGWSSML